MEDQSGETIWCEAEGCEAEAVEEVPVSVKSASDETRHYCWACHEVYTIGVQHGRMSKKREKPKTKEWKILYDAIELCAAYVEAETPEEARQKWEESDVDWPVKKLDYVEARFVEVQDEEGNPVLQAEPTPVVEPDFPQHGPEVPVDKNGNVGYNHGA